MLIFLRSIERIDLLIWKEGQVVPHLLFTVALVDLSDEDRALRRVVHVSHVLMTKYSNIVVRTRNNHFVDFH